MQQRVQARPVASNEPPEAAAPARAVDVKAGLVGKPFAQQEAALALNSTVDPSKITKNINPSAKEVAHGGSGYGYCVPFVKVHPFETEKVGGKVQPNAHVDVSFQVGLKVPEGKVDVASAQSTGLNPKNYAQAVSDLTPDGAGYAPRTRFYSQALTRRHEYFHVSDYVSAGEGIVQRAIDALGKKDIAPEAMYGELKALQEQIRGDLIEYYAGAGRRTASECREDADVSAYTARPGEARAFGDGRPEYQALADGITARFAGGR
jgi:hypothetical protein